MVLGLGLRVMGSYFGSSHRVIKASTGAFAKLD